MAFEIVCYVYEWVSVSMCVSACCVCVSACECVSVCLCWGYTFFADKEYRFCQADKSNERILILVNGKTLQLHNVL